MAWTTAGAAFFLGIGLMLAGMIVWELRSPTVSRRGFLPIPTTRGDRLFISLLLSAFVHLVWLGFSDTPPWPATAVSAGLIFVLMRYG